MTREKYEYDDLSRIARESGRSIAEIQRTLEKRPEISAAAGFRLDLETMLG